MCDRSIQAISTEPDARPAWCSTRRSTSLSYLDWVIDDIDLILLMSVNPGFGGQGFIPATLDKLREVRKLVDASGRDIRIEVDGGIKDDNIAEIKAAGADMFVSGSGIFGKANPADAHRYDSIVRKMRDAMATVNR